MNICEKVNPAVSGADLRVCRWSEAKSNTTMKNHLSLLLAAALLVSCDGFSSASVDVDVEVQDMTEVLVINAEIEKGKAVWAHISYTEDIDAVVDTPQKFENAATVTLSVDDGSSQPETLVLVTTGTYANKGLYAGTTILGAEGKTYTLTVKIGAETYTAKCEMFKEPGIAWFVINGMSNKGVYITTSVTSGGGGGKSDGKSKSAAGGYAEEWKVLDPAATRDRYMFEYYVNGAHLVAKDWAIDDNRVVNSKKDGISDQEGLKLFNVTINPSANQYLNFRVAEIDKPTYDYYNMYEKIVRGLIGVGSVTPYNPKSNFVGKRTVGNFRAVSFSATPGLAPPTPCTAVSKGAVTIQFAASPTDATDKTSKTPYFTKYHLYSGTVTGVDHKSTKQEITPTTAKDGINLAYTVTSPASGANYFRIQVEDKDGFVSPLSPEVTADTTKDADKCESGGTTPTGQCGDLTKACNPKTDKACIGKDKKVYECTGKGIWTEQKVGSMTCGGVTKQCVTQKSGWCQDTNKDWWECKNGAWSKYGGGK